jgi:hypothetical protein
MDSMEVHPPSSLASSSLTGASGGGGKRFATVLAEQPPTTTGHRSVDGCLSPAGPVVVRTTGGTGKLPLAHHTSLDPAT